ncbi:MAG: hypothetical protein ABSB71_08540 [Candidatus Bathyarchaeia archaeon]
MVNAIPAGLREWGSGLEELTECYLKYICKYLVESGRVFQSEKEINHKTVSRSKYPRDIDLIAINPSEKKVVLVSCSESWDKTLEKTSEEFDDYENFITGPQGLGYGNELKVERIISCVNISENKKLDLKKEHIVVLKACKMISELRDYLKKDNNRKGAHRETILWLLQTLDKCYKIEELNE